VVLFLFLLTNGHLINKIFYKNKFVVFKEYIKRDKYKGHKYYKDTVDFCENWDQKSFDPNFKSLPLKEFEPFVKKIFSRKPYSN